MVANYKLVRNPNPNPEKTGEIFSLHPRVISNGTIRTDEFIESAKSRSSFSPADMKGILRLFQDVLVDYLKGGYNVDLEGIGTFSVSLKSRAVTQKKQIRSESIHFKDIKFRSSKDFRERLKTMAVFRDSSQTEVASDLSPQQCERRVLSYLDSHPFCTGKDYMDICGCSKSKAWIDLKRMVREGKLYRKRLGGLYLYYKVEEKGPNGQLQK